MSAYHKPRLNRFDLDVSDMLGSEHVKQMDDRQFGQYMFLLLESWSIGKDCSLPGDDAALAKLARVSTAGQAQLEAQVDPMVLKKFRKTEDGRLVNDRMLSEWKNAKKRVKIQQEKSSKGGKASVASKLKSKQSSSTGQPAVQLNVNQIQATIPGSISGSVSNSNAVDGMNEMNEGKKEVAPLTTFSSDQDSCQDSIKSKLIDTTCSKHPHQASTPPVEPQPRKVAASPEAIDLCRYAIAELTATGIPTKSYPDSWLADADAILAFGGNDADAVSDLKAMFSFARRDTHFMKFTFGVPDFKRHLMSISEKGLKQKFYNARFVAQKQRKARQQEPETQTKQPKFQGELI